MPIQSFDLVENVLLNTPNQIIIDTEYVLPEGFYALVVNIKGNQSDILANLTFDLKANGVSITGDSLITFDNSTQIRSIFTSIYLPTADTIDFELTANVDLGTAFFDSVLLYLCKNI